MTDAIFVRRVGVVAATAPILFSLLAACGGPPANAPAAGADGNVVLLSAGAEPRAPLRYHVAPGDREEVTYVLATTTEPAGPAAPSPMRMTVDIAVTDVAPDGRIGFDLTTKKVEGSPVPLDGMRGHLVMNDRGRVERAEMTPPPDAPANAQAVFAAAFESVKQGLGVCFLPRDPVGPGARWRTTSEVKILGIATAYKMDFELVSCSAGGGACEIKTHITQSAGHQAIDIPGTAAGATMEVISFAADGDGTMSLDFSKVAPKRASDTTSGTLEMKVTVGDDPHVMTMKTKTLSTIAGQ